MALLQEFSKFLVTHTHTHNHSTPAQARGNYVDVEAEHCLAISRVAYSLYRSVGTSHHTTWLQHYDSNAPLLGHLIDAGAMGRQTTNRR